MNDYFGWQVARMRAAELRAEASEARLAGALRRSRRGPGRYSVRAGGFWGVLVAAWRPTADDAGEVCCA